MGKGDNKSKKGKRFQHSFGKTRKRKKGRLLSSRKKFEAKAKPVDHKKPSKPEPEIEKPAKVIETKTEEIIIQAPVISEIKEEVKVPEIREEAVSKIPEVNQATVVESVKTEVPVNESTEKEPAKEESAPTVQKKRGRPKKKKDE